MLQVKALTIFQIVILSVILQHRMVLSSPARPQVRSGKPVAITEPKQNAGADYLALEEDDEEFPEESMAVLRQMAQSFRSGLASALTQGGAGAEAAGGEGGEEAKEESPMVLVMKYVTQIFAGFQSMRKGFSDMFQQIATAGGQQLANRIQKRLGKWVQQGTGQLSGLAQQAQGALGGAASSTRPF